MAPALRTVVRAVYVRSRVRELLPIGARRALRRLWVRLAWRASYPISTPKLQRPDLPAARKPMRLTHVLLASDLKPDYLDCWPLARRAWLEVCDLEPVLLLVAAPDAVPPALRGDERVRVFAPVEGIHTAFQAQCIRLLYPALIETDGAVLISDMELVPVDPDYYHRPPRLLDERFFLSYRDVRLGWSQVAIAYNAARPETWHELFRVASEQDARGRLAQWAGAVEYEGIRGGDGWYTDQERLYDALWAWPDRAARHWMLDDEYTGFRRLEREDVRAGGLTPALQQALRGRRYTDYDCLVPRGDAAAVNSAILELVSGSLGGR